MTNHHYGMGGVGWKPQNKQYIMGEFQHQCTQYMYDAMYMLPAPRDDVDAVMIYGTS